ncbi:MAG: hypothetical protein OXI48_05010 [bacterium]|nr:hypothetical protein [bacterium]
MYTIAVASLVEFRPQPGTLGIVAATDGVRPSLRRDWESVEYLGFGHPIIDAIRKKVLDGGHAGTVGAWALPEGRDLPPSQGWLFVFVLDTTGLEPRSDLLPVYVADDDDVSTEMGSALVKRAGFWKSEESEIELRDIPSDGLENARLLAEAVVLRSQDDRMESAQASAAENLERGTQRVSEWFEQRERVAASKLTDVASTLNRLRASSESGDQRILSVWEAKYRDAKQLVEELPRERDQRIASLERDCTPAIEWRLVAAARIEIRRRRGGGEVGSRREGDPAGPTPRLSKESPRTLSGVC